MAVFRVEKNKDFTVMSNYHFRDRKLSLKAKGLLSQILSLPDDWDYTLAGLATLSSDGVDSVRKGVTELEQNGYLIRHWIRNANGRIGGIEYVVYEHPILPASGKPLLENPITVNPTSVNPTQEKPILEKPTELNTYLSNTNRSNTYESNTHSFLPVTETNESKDYECYRKTVMEQINYNYLLAYRKVDQGELENLVDLLTDTMASRKAAIRIGREDKPAAVVKGQLMKLSAEHIEFVLDCLHKNTSEVRNIRSYLLTSLYNAPSTMDSHYMAQVNHDLALSEGSQSNQSCSAANSYSNCNPWTQY